MQIMNTALRFLPSVFPHAPQTGKAQKNPLSALYNLLLRRSFLLIMLFVPSSRYVGLTIINDRSNELSGLGNVAATTSALVH